MSDKKRKRLDLGPGPAGEAEVKMSATNPLTNKPYSQKYFDIFKTRQVKNVVKQNQDSDLQDLFRGFPCMHSERNSTNC